MSGPPYISSDDSALLRRALRGRSGGAFLEIGTGNGGTLVALSGRFGTVVGTDLTRPDMQDWRSNAGVLLASGASCFRNEVFDLVAFNPPYLAEEVGDRAVDGGRGLGVPKSFLAEALRVVKKSGSVVFLLNQDARLSEFEDVCRRGGFGVRLLEAERTFYETLSVYEARAGAAGGDGTRGAGKT